MRHHLSTALALCLGTLCLGSATAQDATVVDHPPTDTRNPHYPANPEPLQATPFLPLPLGAVEPEGWLRRMLELQAAGFHGRLQELSEYLEKDGNAWLDPDGEGTHGWEEPVYWLKGFGSCAYVLSDQQMIEEARFWVDAILDSQKEDGWFGPDAERTGRATRLEGREDLWPNMIALFCLQDWYEYASSDLGQGDTRVLTLMDRYFDYLRTLPDDRFLVGYWPRMRGGDLLHTIVWRLQREDDENRRRALLDLAAKVHRNTARWDEGVINWHNVNMAQGFGEPGTWWLVSGEDGDRQAAYDNFTEIRQSYGQVPGGMFGGDENCRRGYDGPRQAIETCGMVEMMLSHETLLWITGDPLWGDRCEDVAFNSLPASTTADLKALRYLTAPNMPLSDSRSKAPGIQNGGPMFQMNPHRHRCCQHNFGHGWPYFARHAVLATSDAGLATALYTDCRVTARAGDGPRVTLDVDTHYPFEEDISVRVADIEGRDSLRFPLYLRVPQWCDEPQVRLGDAAVELPASDASGRYLKLERDWQQGDVVTLTLPMEVGLRRWEDNGPTVSVDYGPLTFSLEIGEEYRRVDGGSDTWPIWEIWPTTPWNYALDEASPGAFEVVRGAWPESDLPFTHAGTPLRLKTRARRVPEWRLDHQGLIDEVGPSPVRAADEVETVTLIPMGAARLRLSAFPIAAGEGEEGAVWEMPPQPLYDASASHTYGGDTILGVCDGKVPEDSNDHDVPRHTFWPHRGTEEWLQAGFDEPRPVERVAIYWFDDSPRGGGCRVPASWRLLYRDADGNWQPVAGVSEYGVDKDHFNVVTFDAVTTDALRAEIQLQDDASAGVLEWRIGDAD